MSTLNVPSVSEVVKSAEPPKSPSEAKTTELSTSTREISESTAEVAASLSEQKTLSAESIEKIQER
jgi:hypothetical protein